MGVVASEVVLVDSWVDKGDDSVMLLDSGVIVVGEGVGGVVVDICVVVLDSSGCGCGD